MRVLVVDDSPVCRELVSWMLARHGFDVVQAGDGVEALTAAAMATPDLIILDVNMPVLDGVGFLRAFRRQPEGKRVPVILLTGGDSAHTLRHALELGVHECMLKGQFDVDALIARIAKVMGVPVQFLEKAALLRKEAREAKKSSLKGVA